VRRRYAPGALVEIYYDPRRPSRSVLQKTTGAGGTILLLVSGSLFGTIGFFLARFAIESLLK
jgi:hypothetical protein